MMTTLDDDILWQEFKAGSPKAREQLIHKHLHLVKYAIGRIMARYQLDKDAVSVEDLYSCGVLGLMEAVDGFDPSRLPDPTDPDRLEAPGGRGVMLIRAFMDKVQYNQTGNSVVLEKHRRSR